MLRQTHISYTLQMSMHHQCKQEEPIQGIFYKSSFCLAMKGKLKQLCPFKCILKQFFGQRKAFLVFSENRLLSPLHQKVYFLERVADLASQVLPSAVTEETVEMTFQSTFNYPVFSIPYQPTRKQQDSVFRMKTISSI